MIPLGIRCVSYGGGRFTVLHNHVVHVAIVTIIFGVFVIVLVAVVAVVVVVAVTSATVVILIRATNSFGYAIQNARHSGRCHPFR